MWVWSFGDRREKNYNNKVMFLKKKRGTVPL